MVSQCGAADHLHAHPAIDVPGCPCFGGFDSVGAEVLDRSDFLDAIAQPVEVWGAFCKRAWLVQLRADVAQEYGRRDKMSTLHAPGRLLGTVRVNLS